MLTDISTRADIEIMVNRFYDKVKSDDLISFFFTDIVQVNWPAHLPKMYDFWESIAFGTSAYKGEPMTAHIQLSKKQAMTVEHFNRWLKLFQQTIDENFSGEKADEIKMRAGSIATIMQIKTKS